MKKTISIIALASFAMMLAWTGFANAGDHEPVAQGKAEHAGEVEKPCVHHNKMSKEYRRQHWRHWQKRFQMLDTSEDGKVDLDEYLAHAEQRFKEMDTNNDQLVTHEEARQQHHEMRKKHHKHRQKLHDSDGDDAKLDKENE